MYDALDLTDRLDAIRAAYPDYYRSTDAIRAAAMLWGGVAHNDSGVIAPSENVHIELAGQALRNDFTTLGLPIIGRARGVMKRFLSAAFHKYVSGSDGFLPSPSQGGGSPPQRRGGVPPGPQPDTYF